MKNLIILYVIISFQYFQAQEKYSVGGNLDFNIRSERYYDYNDDYYGPYTSPLVTFLKGKKQFEIGPLFYFFKRNGDKAIGLIGNYKYFPNGLDNRFNTYFTNGISFYNGMKVSEIFDYSLSLENTIQTEEKFRTNSFTYYLSYGFQYNFLKKVYVATNFGFGLGYFFSNRKAEFVEDNSLNYEEKKGFVNSFVNSGINIGFRF